MKKVPLSFYQRKDVVKIAKELLGKIVVTNLDGQVTSGRIVETEAYIGLTDKASHSFAGKERQEMNTCILMPAQPTFIFVTECTRC